MTDEEFFKNKEIVSERKQLREREYLKSSSERLKNIVDKKINTTMIGAISAIENELPSIMEDLPESKKIQIREAFDRIRSKILDNGNNQKRNLTEEFSQYQIKWDRYHIDLPVKKLGE